MGTKDRTPQRATAPPDVSGREGPARAKRPWTRPKIDSGNLFESNSLSCGKATAELEQCQQNPLTS